jgi:hypothetical protein
MSTTWPDSRSPNPADTLVSAGLPQSVPLVRGGLRGTTVLLIAAFALWFLYHNYLPLFHSDLWGHIAYGSVILQTGKLPTEDPFVELAAGQPAFATAWLSQVIYALIGRRDPEQLANLFALLTLATSLVLWMTYSRQTGSRRLALCGAIAAFVIPWSRHAVQRPENFGALCLAILLWLVVDGERREHVHLWRRPLVFGGLLALWTNLHGSFVIGLVVLLCIVTGRVLETIRRTGSPGSWLQDRGFWQRLLWLEGAVVGTLCHPQGIDLLLQTVVFPSHPNLNAVLEWYPLSLGSLEGIPMVLSWIATIVILRLSHARWTATEVLLLVVFNLAVLLRTRMIAWYGPIWVLAIAPHAADIARRMFSASAAAASGTAWQRWNAPSIRWTAVAVLLVWMTFLCAPLSRPLLGGTPRRMDQLFSRETPLGVTGYLQEHPPRGLCFAPQWWGDWLVWQGPRGLRVMTTTNTIHLLPETVWRDALTISIAEGNWSDRLAKYRIATVLASRDLQPQLCTALRAADDWEVVFEDDVGLIAVRKGAQFVTTEVEDPQTPVMSPAAQPNVVPSSEGPR